jgi:hypothetical protein
MPLIISGLVTRTLARSFWFVLTAGSGGLATGLLWLQGHREASGVAGLVSVALCIAGMFAPGVAPLALRIWNKAAREFARFARMAVMAVCFYVVFALLGWTGSKLKLKRPGVGQSAWVPRNSVSPDAYYSQDAVTPEHLAEKGWLMTFLTWGRGTGNLWACFLLPFLLLISALDTDEETLAPASIYTLF